MKTFSSRSMTIRKSSMILWSLFIIMLCISGFRWDVGIDWMSYYTTFDGDLLKLATFEERIEPGNILIKLLLNTNGYDNSLYWIWSMSFITLFCIFYTTNKLSPLPLFSIALYICLGMYFYSFNGIRQHCAVALTTILWPCLIERKLIKYIIGVIIASLFHKSAMIILPIYFFCRHKFNKNTLIIGLIITLLLGTIASTIIDKVASYIPAYNVYQGSEYAQSNSNLLSYLRILFPLILFSLLIPVYDKLTTDNIQKVFTNLTLISIYLGVLFPNTALGIRINYYFLISQIIFIPMLCKAYSAKNSLIIKTFCIISGFCFIYFTLLSKPVAKILPYQFTLEIANTSLLKITIAIYIILWFYIHLIFIKPVKSKH